MKGASDLAAAPNGQKLLSIMFIASIMVFSVSNSGLSIPKFLGPTETSCPQNFKWH